MCGFNTAGALAWNGIRFWYFTAHFTHFTKHISKYQNHVKLLLCAIWLYFVDGHFSPIFNFWDLFCFLATRLIVLIDNFVQVFLASCEIQAWSTSQEKIQMDPECWNFVRSWRCFLFQCQGTLRSVFQCDFMHYHHDHFLAPMTKPVESNKVSLERFSLPSIDTDVSKMKGHFWSSLTLILHIGIIRNKQ